jgi:hypothetical protein
MLHEFWIVLEHSTYIYLYIIIYLNVLNTCKQKFSKFAASSGPWRFMAPWLCQVQLVVGPKHPLPLPPTTLEQGDSLDRSTVYSCSWDTCMYRDIHLYMYIHTWTMDMCIYTWIHTHHHVYIYVCIYILLHYMFYNGYCSTMDI